MLYMATYTYITLSLSAYRQDFPGQRIGPEPTTDKCVGYEHIMPLLQPLHYSVLRLTHVYTHVYTCIYTHINMCVHICSVRGRFTAIMHSQSPSAPDRAIPGHALVMQVYLSIHLHICMHISIYHACMHVRASPAARVPFLGAGRPGLRVPVQARGSRGETD